MMYNLVARYKKGEIYMKDKSSFANSRTRDKFLFICLIALTFSCVTMLAGCRSADTTKTISDTDVISELSGNSERDTVDTADNKDITAQELTGSQDSSDSSNATDSTDPADINADSQVPDDITDTSDAPVPTEEPSADEPKPQKQPMQESSDPVLAKALSDLVSYKKDDIIYTSAKKYVALLSLDDDITLNEVIANLTKDGFHYYGYYYNVGYGDYCTVVTEDGDILEFYASGQDYNSVYPYYGSTYYLSSVNETDSEVLGQMNCTDSMNREYKIAHTLVNGSWFDANADGIDERFLKAYYLTSYGKYEYYRDSFLLEFPGTDSKYIEWTDSAYAFSFIKPDFMAPILIITPREINCGGDGSGLYSIVGDELIEHGEFLDGHRSIEFRFYEDHMETETTIDTITTIYLDAEYTTDSDGRLVLLLEDGYLSYYDGEFGGVGNGPIAMMDIPVYATNEQGDIAFTLKEGDTIEVLGGNTVDWVKIRNKATQEEGWLNAVRSTIYLPDGTCIYSGDCFDNVGFYG